MSDGIAARLAEPFAPGEVDWKPQAVKGNRALAVAYVDVRTVMDRLDAVFGLGGWQTTYREIPDGVVCRLRFRVNGEWAEHEDVGSFSEQPDGGDRLKAAFSNALKRVAIHVGVGRYLYSLPKQWVDFDPQKRQFTRTPELPRWAVPARPPKAAPPGPPPEPVATAPKPAPIPATKDRARTLQEAMADQEPRGLPATGVELLDRLTKLQASLVAEGRCNPGELVAFVTDAGERAGYLPALTEWDAKGIEFASKITRKFLDNRKRKADRAAAQTSN